MFKEELLSKNGKIDIFEDASRRLSYLGKSSNITERERETERDRERDTERETQRERETETDRQTQRHREREGVHMRCIDSNTLPAC